VQAGQHEDGIAAQDAGAHARALMRSHERFDQFGSRFGRAFSGRRRERQSNILDHALFKPMMAHPVQNEAHAHPWSSHEHQSNILDHALFELLISAK